jgi:hypothetical protein
MGSTLRSSSCALLILLAAGSGCTPAYTVPERVAPTDPVREFDLEVPPGLEIRNVDFSAMEYATDSDGPFAGAIGGRAFLKVYAVDRQTTESVLLIYEDIARRKRPVQIIRFRKSLNGGANGPEQP